MPFEETFAAARRFMALYERMYREEPLPYVLFEVRFTPEGHDRTLLGTGRGRCSTWIDLVCEDSPGYERYYRAAWEVLRGMDARPHLGKWCGELGPDDLRRLHGPHFDAFLDLVREHAPDGVFRNAFTARLLGT